VADRCPLRQSCCPGTPCRPRVEHTFAYRSTLSGRRAKKLIASSCMTSSPC
jgi:hypothetical protein